MGINYLEHKVDENFISKGCYKFSVEKNNNPNLSYETMPFLTLTYKTDEDGKLTNENISASSHKFNLIGPSSAIYSILNKYLGVDWDTFRYCTCSYDANARRGYGIRSEWRCNSIPSNT